MKPQMTFFAGEDLWDDLQEEKEQKIPWYGHGYDSQPLIRLQLEWSERGILGAEVVKSQLGWMVRYDSGIQNFGIIAGGMSGVILDGTLQDAIDFVRKWVKQDPKNRYAFTRSEK
jgi:hypothetical protein